MKLTDYIQQAFDGNIASFAREVNTHRNVVDRWITRGCIWRDGKVYCEVSKRKGDNNEQSKSGR